MSQKLRSLRYSIPHLILVLSLSTAGSFHVPSSYHTTCDPVHRPTQHLILLAPRSPIGPHLPLPHFYFLAIHSSHLPFTPHHHSSIKKALPQMLMHPMVIWAASIKLLCTTSQSMPPWHWAATDSAKERLVKSRQGTVSTGEREQESEQLVQRGYSSIKV